MWGILAVLIAGGIHSGWLALPSSGPMSDVLTDLTVGEAVHVTRTAGRRVNGVISAVSPTGLTVVSGGLTTMRPIFVPAGEVRTVKRQDSVWNGAFAGGVAGVFAGNVAANLACPDDDECETHFLFIVGLPVGTAAGIAIGTGIDALIHSTLYRRPERVQVRVSPIVSRDQTGMRLSVTW